MHDRVSHNVSDIALGFIEAGYKNSDFETIEDLGPMFETLFDAYDYVWIT